MEKFFSFIRNFYVLGWIMHRIQIPSYENIFQRKEMNSNKFEIKSWVADTSRQIRNRATSAANWSRKINYYSISR